jgi:hypothetical protein
LQVGIADILDAVSEIAVDVTDVAGRKSIVTALGQVLNTIMRALPRCRTAKRLRAHRSSSCSADRRWPPTTAVLKT